MPYRWDPSPTDGQGARCVLWPHRSLPPQGFAGFVGLTAACLALPMLAVLGTPVVWAVLPFAALVLWGLWAALRRNAADAAALTEELRLGRDRIEIVRLSRGRRQAWSANPHWVRLNLRPEGGPVENYLTLSGAGREVELGAFLSPEERVALHEALVRALAGLR